MQANPADVLVHLDRVLLPVASFVLIWWTHPMYAAKNSALLLPAFSVLAACRKGHDADLLVHFRQPKSFALCNLRVPRMAETPRDEKLEQGLVNDLRERGTEMLRRLRAGYVPPPPYDAPSDTSSD